MQDQDRHDERADAMGEVDRDLRPVQVGGIRPPNDERKVRNRQARARVPHRRAEQNLRVHRAPSGQSAGAQRRSSTRRGAGARQPADVTSASVTVRQKKICARPAWLIETASGRR